MLTVITPSIRPQYLHITQECLERQTFIDFEWLVEIGLRNRGFTLPSDLNKMLRRAKGERVVMLQDCISIAPDTLEQVDKLPLNDFYTFPVSKNGAWDWRAHRTWEVDPAHWEADFAAAPTRAFFDIGGYDEEFNKGWSWDNVEVAWRAQAAGYRFFCHSEIKAEAIDHDAVIENPFRGKRENNDKRAAETRVRASTGQYRLHYL